MKNIKRFVIYALTLLVFAVNSPPLFAQNSKKPTRILFDFDFSQSMWGQWEGKPKIDVAREVMSKVMDSLKTFKNLQLGLRLFGSQYPVNTLGQNCKDTKLVVPFGVNNEDKIIQALNDNRPEGTTLIAYSLEKCGNDFPDKNGNNIIILITDGIEECNGDPCAVSRALQSKGITLKPFIIGLGIDPSIAQSLKCVGNFFNVTNQAAFQKTLGVIISQVMNQTSVQVNLLDVNGDATETNVPITFYATHLGIQKYNFVHTMNAAGVPDTLPIDPLYEYNMVVHTLPKIEKDSIKLKPGIKNIIAVKAPQGELTITCQGDMYNNLQAIVRQNGSMKTLNVQQEGQETKYIVGTYDLEVLSLPRLYINDVHIDQSHLTKVQVPEPGQLTLMTNDQGYGAVFKINGDKLEWVCNLLTNTTSQSFMLLPGSYKVIFRSVNAHKVILSKEQDFTISSGQSTRLTLD